MRKNELNAFLEVVYSHEPIALNELVNVTVRITEAPRISVLKSYFLAKKMGLISVECRRSPRSNQENVNDIFSCIKPFVLLTPKGLKYLTLTNRLSMRNYLYYPIQGEDTR
jgi:hypothetical protein